MPRFDTYAQGTPCYVELTTPDPEGAAAAYAGLLGWHVDAVDMGPAGVYRPASVDGLSVAGITDHMPGLTGHPAFWTVYLACDDVDATAARVERLDGVVENGPFDVADLGRMVCVKDPTGARVNLWQAGASPGTQWANEVGTPVWNELVSPDRERAKTFYSDLLGVEWTTMPAGGATYDVLVAGGRNCGGATPLAAGGGPPHWNVYWYVDDVDATLTRAAELGFTVVDPPTDMADVGRLARIADPGGARSWVMRG